MNERIGHQPKPRLYITEWHLERGHKQEDLAKLINIKSGTMSKLMSGEMKMTLDYMTRIANALDCRVIDLFRHPDQPAPDSMLEGLDDSQIEKIIQIIDVFKRDGTNG